MVGGHYHSHKIKKSDESKGYGMIHNTALSAHFSFFVFNFFFLYLDHTNVYLQQFRDARQEVAYCLSNCILVLSFFFCFCCPPPFFSAFTIPYILAAVQRCETRGGILSQQLYIGIPFSVPFSWMFCVYAAFVEV